MRSSAIRRCALLPARVSISRKLVGTSTRTTNENEQRERERFSFWFFVFVDGFRFGFRWPPLADEPAEQGIDPTGAGCPCGRSVSGASARDVTDIERGR